MITDWLAQSGVLGLLLLVVLAPGMLIGAGLRLRGLALWAAAPGISTGVLALLALVFSAVGIRWEPLTVAIAILIAAGAIWLLARVPALRSPRPPASGRLRSAWLLLAGLVIGGGVNAARLLTYIGSPSALSQTNDAVFHLNALRWVAETGSASSLDISAMIGGSSFYPAAWHAIASLVVIEHGQIPLVANMLSLLIAAVVWPLGIAFFAHVVSRGDQTITTLAAALSSGLMAFPQLMFEWGVLYPYALSLAIVPVVAALTINGIRSGLAARPGNRLRSALGFLVSAVVGVGGIALSQPSSLLVWALLVLLWGTGFAVRHRGRLSGAARAVTVGLLSGGWMALAGVWAALAYLAGPVLWRSYRGVLGALGDVLMNSHSLLPPALAMSVLLAVGLIVAVRDVTVRWLAIGWALFSVLYVVSVGTDLPLIKRLLTGPWYGDSFRLAAIVPVVVVPLAAIGLAALLRALRSRVGVPQRIALLGAIAVIGVVGVLAVAASPVVLLRVADETDQQSRYTLNDRSYLSEDEYALLRRLDELVPEDALLIGNPSTGVAFAYVLGDRDIVPRTWAPPQSEAWARIALDLRDAGGEPAVCDALAAYGGPGYVLDFGPGDTGPGQYMMPGMTDFEGRPGFDEVAREGEASLWRITACD